MAFRKAERKKAKARIALMGPSGSGKTYSSLLIAKGLAGDGKIAMIDTESGRGELYASLTDYDVATISPPFTPKKYIDTIKEAEDAGYNIIIIDSLTHAWAGEGGMLEMVDKATKASGSKNSFAAWRKVTPWHNKLIDAILSSKAHIITTIRTKTSYEIQEVNGRKMPVKIGLNPVFRDGIEYEFLLCLDLSVDSHVATPSKDNTGIFDGTDFTPTTNTGEQILEWFNSGADVVEEPPPPEPKQDINTPNTTSPAQLRSEIGKMVMEMAQGVKDMAVSVYESATGFDSIAKTPDDELDKAMKGVLKVYDEWKEIENEVKKEKERK